MALCEGDRNGLGAPGATVSRFVIWRSASLTGCSAEDQEWFAEFSQATGYQTLRDIHGLAPLSMAGWAEALDPFLVRNNLGVLANAWWPADAAPADAASRPLSNESIAVLGLSVRSTLGLIRHGVSSIGDLLQLRTEDLMALRNLGQGSVLEIQEKLAPLEQRGLKNQPAPSTGDAFSLAVLMNVDDFGLSKKLVQFLKRAGATRVYDLVTRSPVALRQARPPEIRELLIWLARFGLRLEMSQDGCLRAHYGELRSAFRDDIARLTVVAADAAESPTAVTGSPQARPPEPACLEDELQTMLSPGLSHRKAQIIRRFLGWDGAPNATLERTGQAFGITRERVRQIVAKSLPKPEEVDPVFLRRAIACIAAHLPSSLERAEAALQEAGLVRGPFPVESLIATAQTFEVPLPWRIESWLGGRLVVNDEHSRQIRRFHLEARRRVSHYGASRKAQVLSEFSGQMTAEAADLACSVLEGLRWLDEVRDWFWIPTGRNALLNRLAKVLGVAPRLPLEEAQAAVMRDQRMSGADLPAAAFRNLCNALPWCRVNGDYVVAGPGLPRGEDLESDEDRLIDILQTFGPCMRIADLLRAAAGRGITEASVRRLLYSSSVIARHTQIIYGLIGSDGVVPHAQDPQPGKPARGRPPVFVRGAAKAGTIPCAYCGKAFEHANALSGHIQSAHPAKPSVAKALPAARAKAGAPSAEPVAAPHSGVIGHLKMALLELARRQQGIEEQLSYRQTLQSEKEAVARRIDAVRAALQAFEG